jgi:hypothetical protein
MPKTLTAEPETSQKDESKKQRKKQAKKEAKIMLKVEQAKKGLEKAQKKLTRAQSNLDESQTHLHELEEQLQQIRTSREPQSQASQTPPGDAAETQPEGTQVQEVSDEVYQEPLLVAASTPPQADTEATDISTDSAPISTSSDEQPLTPAESDEQTTPAPAAVAETDTTSPQDTATNGSSILSPDEAQSLVEHGNVETEEPATTISTYRYNSLSTEPDVQESNPEEKP